MLYYIVLGIILVVSIIARLYIQASLNKYFDMKSFNQLSGFEIANKVLKDNNKNNIYIIETKSNIFNYYDVNNNSIKLSKETFNGEDLVNNSLALFVASIACMEDKYYSFRSRMYKIINYIIRMTYILLILCMIICNEQLCYACILIMVIIFAYQLISFSLDKEVINKCVNNDNSENNKKILKVIKYKELSIFIDTIVNIFRC